MEFFLGKAIIIIMQLPKSFVDVLCRSICASGIATLACSFNSGRLYVLYVESALPAFHVQTAPIGHENLLVFLLDSSLHRRVIAAAWRMAHHRNRCIPEIESSKLTHPWDYRLNYWPVLNTEIVHTQCIENIYIYINKINIIKNKKMMMLVY